MIVLVTFRPDHGDLRLRGQRSTYRGERRRPQHRGLDVGDQQAVLLAFVAGLVPVRIGLERIPFLLALGE